MGYKYSITNIKYLVRNKKQQVINCADSRPKMHTHWASPGVVVAVGNTGEFLDHAADATCTYLSRDGGMSPQHVSHLRKVETRPTCPVTAVRHGCLHSIFFVLKR